MFYASAAAFEYRNILDLFGWMRVVFHARLSIIRDLFVLYLLVQ